MFKFRNWFAFAALFLMFFVVCEGRLTRLTKKSKHDGVAAVQSDVAVTLTETEKQAAVDRHNHHRRGEGASDMQKMKWNEFLADMAAEWVSGCVFKHGHPPRDKLPFEYIGQNLLSSSHKEDLATCTDVFFKEKSNFDFDTNSCREDSVCGHYTQVVWSFSTDIGCGVAYCNSSGKSWYNHACNYGPGGNYVGDKPYEKGPACSKCAADQTCDDGLCK